MWDWTLCLAYDSYALTRETGDFFFFFSFRRHTTFLLAGCVLFFCMWCSVGVVMSAGKRLMNHWTIHFPLPAWLRWRVQSGKCWPWWEKMWVLFLWLNCHLNEGNEEQTVYLWCMKMQSSEIWKCRCWWDERVVGFCSMSSTRVILVLEVYFTWRLCSFLYFNKIFRSSQQFAKFGEIWSALRGDN